MPKRGTRPRSAARARRGQRPDERWGVPVVDVARPELAALAAAPHQEGLPRTKREPSWVRSVRSALCRPPLQAAIMAGSATAQSQSQRQNVGLLKAFEPIEGGPLNLKGR